MMNTVPEEAAKRRQVRQQAAERHWEALRRKLTRTAAAGLDQEAVAAHFAQMPLRYWMRMDEPTVRWHLDILQTFLAGLSQDGFGSLVPVVRSRHFPSRGFTEVVVCTWDRLGLLANIAGAFAEADLNIVRADIYTRGDNVVLDVFHVCVGEYGHVVEGERLQETERLLAGLCHPRAALPLLGSAPCVQPAPSMVGAAAAELPAVHWDNEMSDEYSVLHLEAMDCIGLLYHVFGLLSRHELNVAQAVITTVDSLAGDVFFITAKGGGKITDPSLQRTVAEQLCAQLRASPS